MFVSLRPYGALLLGLLLLGCARPHPAPPQKQTNSSAAFPITLTDATGESVTIATRPLRLVSIAPTVTEMLYAIGAGQQLVGDTEQCDYPAAAKQLPKVGQWWQPSAERILALKPDLVFAQRGNTLDTLATLRKAGLPSSPSPPRVWPTSRPRSNNWANSPASRPARTKSCGTCRPASLSSAGKWRSSPTPSVPPPSSSCRSLPSGRPVRGPFRMKPFARRERATWARACRTSRSSAWRSWWPRTRIGSW